MIRWDFVKIYFHTSLFRIFRLSSCMTTRVGQILGQIKFEEEYSVIRCRDKNVYS